MPGTAPVNQKVIADPPSAAELAARVAGMQWQVPPAGAFYLDIPSDGRVSTVLAAQWFLALTDTWTLDANAVASDTVVRDPRQTVAVAVHILESHPAQSSWCVVRSSTRCAAPSADQTSCPASPACEALGAVIPTIRRLEQGG